jgi:hypothetical protein
MLSPLKNLDQISTLHKICVPPFKISGWIMSLPNTAEKIVEAGSGKGYAIGIEPFPVGQTKNMLESTVNIHRSSGRLGIQQGAL